MKFILVSYSYVYLGDLLYIFQSRSHVKEWYNCKSSNIIENKNLYLIVCKHLPIMWKTTQLKYHVDIPIKIIILISCSFFISLNV